MKITQPNILAVACATLLLIAVLTPTQANTRHKQPAHTPGAQYDTPTPASYRHSGKARYAQNEAASNAQDNDKYDDQKKYKRTPRNSDSQSSAANAQNNDQRKDQRAPRDSDSQSEGPAVSRSEAAAIAERATGGRVLSVRESGRYWQVKVLVDDKRVRFVNVDMRSGRVR